MEKEGGAALSKEEIAFIGQLINSLGQTALRLEESYEKKDHDNFSNSKRLIDSISKKIEESLR